MLGRFEFQKYQEPSFFGQRPSFLIMVVDTNFTTD